MSAISEFQKTWIACDQALSAYLAIPGTRALEKYWAGQVYLARKRDAKAAFIAADREIGETSPAVEV